MYVQICPFLLLKKLVSGLFELREDTRPARQEVTGTRLAKALIFNLKVTDDHLRPKHSVLCDGPTHFKSTPAVGEHGDSPLCPHIVQDFPELELALSG